MIFNNPKYSIGPMKKQVNVHLYCVIVIVEHEKDDPHEGSSFKEVNLIPDWHQNRPSYLSLEIPRL